MNRARQFRLLTIGLLLALLWLPGEASAAQCGSTAPGFEAWKRQFAGEAQARGVSASTIAALMATTHSTAHYRRSVKTVGDPEGLRRAFVQSLQFIEGTVRVLPGAAKQRPNLVAPLAHTTRALWRDRAERRSHGAAE